MTEIVQPEIRTVRVSDLHPFDRNPRQISDGALEGLDRSLHKFGLVEPIVWNERSGRVVGGHQRLKILLEAGAEATDVVVVDLNDEDEKALNIVLNNPATAGEYDDQLEGLLDEIEAYIGDDFEALRLDELREPMAPATEDVPPPLPTGEPTCKVGDVIELGPHRLVVGDSTDPEVVAALMQGALASLVVTDPPYGVAIVGGARTHCSPRKGNDAAARRSRTTGSMTKPSACSCAMLRLRGPLDLAARSTSLLRQVERKQPSGLRSTMPSTNSACASFGSRAASSSAVRIIIIDTSRSCMAGGPEPHITSSTTARKTPCGNALVHQRPRTTPR